MRQAIRSQEGVIHAVVTLVLLELVMLREGARSACVRECAGVAARRMAAITTQAACLREYMWVMV